MNFGDKLYTLRKSKGYSQDSLAEKLCVSRQAVSKWELGEMLPDAENVIKLAKLFSVSTDYLLTDNTVDNLRRSKLIGLFTNKFDIVDFLLQEPL